MQSSVQINLLSYNKFEQAYKKDGVAYALVVVGKNEEPAMDVPIEVRNLTEKFKGLAPEEKNFLIVCLHFKIFNTTSILFQVLFFLIYLIIECHLLNMLNYIDKL